MAITEKRRKWMKEYIKKYRKINNKQLKIKNIERLNKIKSIVINHYSSNTSKCLKCGFSDIRALSIDHINNDGNIHRKKMSQGSIYLWLRANKFPKGFQVLCFNCNWIKYIEQKISSRL